MREKLAGVDAGAGVGEARVGAGAGGAGVDAGGAQLPPDAAARDAARREAIDQDDTLRGEDIEFHTRHLTDWERAAVIATLTQVRSEETSRKKRVKRREREPWARSQRIPEGIADLLADS